MRPTQRSSIRHLRRDLAQCRQSVFCCLGDVSTRVNLRDAIPNGVDQGAVKIGRCFVGGDRRKKWFDALPRLEGKISKLLWFQAASTRQIDDVQYGLSPVVLP